MVIFAVLTVFWLFLTVFDKWYIVPIVKNTQNHWCTNRHKSIITVPTVYQRCTNRQKQSETVKKNSQNSKNSHWCTNRYRTTKTVPTVYQSSKTVKRQSKQQKWPLVYQSSQDYQDCTNSVPIIKNSQKTVKAAKMTIGVPIVTCLPRMYQSK